MPFLAPLAGIVQLFHGTSQAQHLSTPLTEQRASLEGGRIVYATHGKEKKA